MNELLINYTLSKNIKMLGIIVGGYLIGVSAGLAISQALDKKLAFFFFAGIIGIILGLIMILSVTSWQKKPMIKIDNDQFHIYLPKQRIDGAIFWENVTQLGIGLSYLTMQTNTGKNYKIDLENLKYSDLRDVKTKLIEVCEAKNIPYSNI